SNMPYTNSSDPWTFDAATPELKLEIQEALSQFQPQPEGFAGQFVRFYDALQTGEELPVTLTDARASLALITALYHSALTRRRVELPIMPDHPKYAGWAPQV